MNNFIYHVVFAKLLPCLHGLVLKIRILDQEQAYLILKVFVLHFFDMFAVYHFFRCFCVPNSYEIQYIMILKVTLIFIHPFVTYFCGSAPSNLIFILHFAQNSSSEWLVFETATKTEKNSQKYFYCLKLGLTSLTRFVYMRCDMWVI